MSKATKEQANYRKGSKDRHCAICTMFREPHGCTAVEGLIERDDVCDYFKRKVHAVADEATTEKIGFGEFLSIQAMSLSLDISKKPHPNKMPFSGIMTRIDEPSDTAPNGSDGKRVMITKAAAEQALESLLGMAVDYQDGFDGHDPRAKIGVITGATINGNAICIEGFIYAADFPEVAKEIKANKDTLGFSFEARDLMTTDAQADPVPIAECIFTGAAILLKQKAAYKSTYIEAAKAISEEVFNMDEAAQKQFDALSASLEKVAEAVAAQGETLAKLQEEKVQAANHLAKVERHASELEKAADHMDAAGIGGHPTRGHAAILRHMAGDLRANAAQGKMPHVYDFFVASTEEAKPVLNINADELKAALDKATAEFGAKLEEVKAEAEKVKADEVGALKTKLADMELAATKVAASTEKVERKTLSATDAKLLSKTGLEPDGNGKLNMGKLDTILASMLPSPEKRIEFKTALASVGMID